MRTPTPITVLRRHVRQKATPTRLPPYKYTPHPPRRSFFPSGPVSWLFFMLAAGAGSLAKSV